MHRKNAHFPEFRIFNPKIIFLSRDSPIHIDDLFFNDFNGDGSDVFQKCSFFGITDFQAENYFFIPGFSAT